MSYKKPILKEIYAEAYYSSKMGSTEMMKNALQFIEKFPIIENDKVNDKNILDVKIVPQTRIRCWSKDKKKLIQFYENRIAYNCIDVYDGWDEFKHEVDSVIGKFDKDMFTHLTLCYMDNFKIGKVDYNFSNLFKCCEYIPKFLMDSTYSIDLKLGKGMLIKDDTNNQFHIQVKDIGSEMEISIITAKGLKSQYDIDNFEFMHTYCIEVFEKVITDHIRDVIMEGEKTDD